jgi:hypothetical protein
MKSDHLKLCIVSFLILMALALTSGCGDDDDDDNDDSADAPVDDDSLNDDTDDDVDDDIDDDTDDDADDDVNDDINDDVNDDVDDDVNDDVDDDAEALQVGHLAADGFSDIPVAYFQQIRDENKVFYGHTSHGSQVVSGVNMLADVDGVLYASPTFHEPWDDLGHLGDTSWVAPTEGFLGNPANEDYNVVMWSWCGGCSDNTEQGINAYLDAMEQLEADYSDITFVYMTGHLDEDNEANLLARNQQIRDYCADNNKILYDFADIESWDPDGVFYPHDDDQCYWCTDWCNAHPGQCPACDYCAHSHCFNCYRKGKAFWWMMAKLAGWNA